MTGCLIMSRGATRAQMMSDVLTGAGIPARVVRPPLELSADGCGYAVAVTSQLTGRALELLKLAKLPPRRVYCEGQRGYEERH